MTTRGQFTKKMLADINLRETRPGVFEYIGPAQNNRPKNKSVHRNPAETQ
ncbi:MAG: hypothetical protein GX206_02765 [Clostridiales bacterium]|mgnify:CR=1 FL=1|nr:hypothetical protein [Clostridiales bacterium]